MSRVGKKVIAVPSGVQVSLGEDLIKVSGKMGALDYQYSNLININYEAESSFIEVTPKNDNKKSRELWGLTRANIANMVRGVSEGLVINLELIGVGFKVQLVGNYLIFSLGYSHDIALEIPNGISVTCSKPTSIKLTSNEIVKIGEFSSKIKNLRKFNIYKGKGIKEEGKVVILKETKKN